MLTRFKKFQRKGELMNFEFSSDQMLLKDQARKFLENEESVKKAREV